MSRDIYIFAGGGTGGHLYPGLAVAAAIRQRDPDALMVFACSNRSIDRAILSAKDVAYVPQAVLPVPSRPKQIIPFLRAWKNSRKQAKDLMDDLKPKAILGLGGFAAGPVLPLAASRGVRVGLLNPDIVPGKANRFLAGKVNAIFTQFESTQMAFSPKDQPKVKKIGCPIRKDLLDGDRDEAMHFFGLDPAKKTLLVFGGSTLAESILMTMDLLVEDLKPLADQWQVLMPAGKGRESVVRSVFRVCGVGIAAPEYCERMDLAWPAGDLALTRGGAGTIAELAATGTPAVIMPYPHHKDRQQYGNAEEMVQSGAAVIVDDANEAAANAERLRNSLIPILQDEAKLSAMKQAAEQHRGSRAAAEAADWLMN